MSSAICHFFLNQPADQSEQIEDFIFFPYTESKISL